MIVARKVKRKERDHLFEYVEKVRAYMWLGSWLLHLDYDEATVEDESGRIRIGSCKATSHYREAEITFAPEIFDRDPDQIRETVVHELVHCHYSALQHLHFQTLDRLKSREAEAFYNMHVRLMEEHVTVMTRLIVPSVPEYVPLKKAKR